MVSDCDTVLKTYYDFLGISQDATKEQIKSAYRKLSIKFHPDKNNGDFYFETMFKNINEAQEVLMDDTKRANYDYKLKRSKSSNADEAELRRREEELRRKQEEILRKEQELNRQRFSQRPEATSSSAVQTNDEFDWGKVVNFFWLLNIGLVLLIFITPNKNDRVLKTVPKVNEAGAKRPSLGNKTYRVPKAQYKLDTISDDTLIDTVKKTHEVLSTSIESVEKINSPQGPKLATDSLQDKPKADSLREKPKWYQFKKMKEWKKKKKGQN